VSASGGHTPAAASWRAEIRKQRLRRPRAAARRTVKPCDPPPSHRSPAHHSQATGTAAPAVVEAAAVVSGMGRLGSRRVIVRRSLRPLLPGGRCAGYWDLGVLRVLGYCCPAARAGMNTGTTAGGGAAGGSGGGAAGAGGAPPDGCGAARRATLHRARRGGGASAHGDRAGGLGRAVAVFFAGCGLLDCRKAAGRRWGTIAA